MAGHVVLNVATSHIIRGSRWQYAATLFAVFSILTICVNIALLRRLELAIASYGHILRSVHVDIRSVDPMVKLCRLLHVDRLTIYKRQGRRARQVCHCGTLHRGHLLPILL